MSLLNKASLIQIPSGYKDGTLYSAKPTNGDGDFTFSRGSNLAATRVNSDGLIEKGRENLLLQSNQFDVYWTGSGSWTATSNQSGYDGSNDAWLLADADATGNSFRKNISNTGVLTFSAYFKAGSIDGVRIRIIASPSNVDTWWNLADSSTEPYSQVSGIIDRKKEILTNGWVRLSITFNATSTSSIRLYSDDGSTKSYAIGNFYIQDAQLEAGLVATDYIETGASTAQAGILEDMPRLDYSGGASCPALLLEPQRQNIYTQSEYNPASSGAGRLNWTGDSYEFCDAFNTPINAYKAVGTGSAYLFIMVGLASTGEYTYSAFVKLPTSNAVTSVKRVKINTFNQFQNSDTYFDLVNGTIVSSTANASSIEAFPDGWYRISVTETAIGTNSGFGFLMYPVDENNNDIDLQSADLNKNVIVTAGWQLEEGSYPTSYIPTYGASVTRGADSCIDGGVSSTFNDSEGVLYVEISALADDSENRIVSVSDGTTSTRALIQYYTSSNTIRGFVQGGGVSATLTYTASDITANTKIAFKYKSGDHALWVNGTQRSTDTTAITLSGLDDLSFDNGAGDAKMFANVKQVLYFPTALSNDELATLTTL